MTEQDLINLLLKKPTCVHDWDSTQGTNQCEMNIDNQVLVRFRANEYSKKHESNDRYIPSHFETHTVITILGAQMIDENDTEIELTNEVVRRLDSYVHDNLYKS